MTLFSFSFRSLSDKGNLLNGLKDETKTIVHHTSSQLTLCSSYLATLKNNLRSIHIVANGKISFFFLWLSNMLSEISQTNKKIQIQVRQILHDFTYMWNVKNEKNKHKIETVIETELQIWRTNR